VNFKILVKETGTELKEVLPYTLGLLSNRISGYLRLITLLGSKKLRNQEDVMQDNFLILNEFIDISYYIYSMAPRVNSTIKLCRIINLVTEALNNRQNSFYIMKHQIYKTIFDLTADVLKRNVKKKYARLESLYC
jgi:hypothetical protein